MFRCFASCSFGLESEVAFELKKAGFSNVKSCDARVYFDANEGDIFHANLILRTADRVYIEIGKFIANTFDELFNKTASLRFEDYIPKDAAFPVTADSVKSDLKSVSDIQSICKKAIVERLKLKYHISHFPESKERYNVYVNILKDTVTVSLNTSGEGLNRRGYRIKNVAAPIRETLAAGILLLSRYKGESNFLDPLCGSGTIAIEAALIAKGILPGAKRSFDIENWRAFDLTKLKELRYSKKDLNKNVKLQAFDIDEKAVYAARANAASAGVLGDIEFKVRDVSKLELKNFYGNIVSNPPYAIRIGEQNGVRELYKNMGKVLLPNYNSNLSIICADDEFERYFGKRADSKRKLYNGNIRCTLFKYRKNAK
ncbi:MAG: class I SAM-dependent RNA methyltransferase [Eubacteriales bacterium]